MAAEEEHSPIIIQFGPGQMKNHAHMEEMIPIVRELAARVHVPVALNLDGRDGRYYFRILPPDYCTPEETPTGHEAILVLQKSRFIQIDASRTVKKPQSFPARKWEAFCLNWLPYLWRARDTLLRRRVEPPKH